MFGSYKEGIAIFCFATIGMGYFIGKQTLNHELDSRIRLLLYFCLGSIPLCAACYVLFLLGHFWPWVLYPGSYLILFFSISVLIKGLWTGDIKIAWNTHVIYIGILIFLLFIMRLSFLKHIILPSYSDSPIHYQIIYGLLHPEQSNISNLSFTNLFRDYYHFGFHVLSAWTTIITNIDPINAISLLGQIFLVIVPLSVWIMVYVFTRNFNGAFFAGLLAAIAWPMPAFAVNWGKFPALVALSLFPIFIAYSSLLISNPTKTTKAIYWWLILVVGMVSIHTRIAICLVLALIASFLSNRLLNKNELEFSQAVRLSLLFVLSLWPISQLIANFYVGFPLWIVLLVLLHFAFQAHAKLAVGISLFTTGMWVITLVPQVLFKNDQIFLDRQFLEIMLYIPFSALGGIGFEGLTKKLSLNQVSKWIAVTVLIGGVMFNFRNTNPLFPDSCCNYFRESDQLAFQWLQKNVSDQSLIIISSFSDGNKIYGTDAGVWIFPLLGTSTNKLPFNTNWHSPDVMREICSIDSKEIYIYTGGRENSFANAQLLQEKWIRPVYKSGDAEIYQVSKCL
jgi:hypothetical protein